MLSILVFAAVSIHSKPNPALDLQKIVDAATSSTLAQFGSEKLKPEELEISLAQLDRTAKTYRLAHTNGDQNMYPASVVKLFFAGYLAHQLDRGKAKLNPELERATKDMLVDSSNDATGLVLDTITGTTGGPSLAPKDLKSWMRKRQGVNDWLKALGYENINACQKTWNEGPYGREKQGYGPNMELRNALSANSCTRFMAELALGQLASQAKSDWILAFMNRKTGEDGSDVGGQTKGFLGQSIPKDWERWTKAGLAYQVRHDVCYFKTKVGSEFVLTVFTDHHGSNESLLPFIGANIVSALSDSE